MSEVDTTVTEEAAAAEQPVAGLSIVDLANVVAVIDAVTQRGGFRGEEMEAIGTLRNRFAAFVAAAQQAQQQQETSEEAPAEEEFEEVSE